MSPAVLGETLEREAMRDSEGAKRRNWRGRGDSKPNAPPLCETFRAKWRNPNPRFDFNGGVLSWAGSEDLNLDAILYL